MEMKFSLSRTAEAAEVNFVRKCQGVYEIRKKIKKNKNEETRKDLSERHSPVLHETRSAFRLLYTK
jgi:hypothetical protein